MDDIILLILACAAATYVTRIGGHLILSSFGTIHHRVSAALDAVPIAVMTALVAPALVTHGPAEVIALVCAGVTALRAPLMVSVALGLIALMGLRSILG